MAAYLKLVGPEDTIDEFMSAREHLEGLITRLRSSETAGMTHAELEHLVEQQGREVERRLLQGHLELRAAREPKLASVIGADEQERTHRRARPRPLATMFGRVQVPPMAYSARGVPSLCPLDAALNLPKERYSHGLRHEAVREAISGSFDQAVERIDAHTGNQVPKRQVEELVVRAACDFDDFYASERAVPVSASAKDLLVLSLDSKGLVMRHEHLLPDTQKKAQAARPKLGRRLSAGEKKNRKRMATVAALYTLAPEPRTPGDVLGDLRPEPGAKKPARPRPQNKRVWARIAKTAEQVTQEVFAEALRRDPERQRRWVVLVDGDLHQIARIEATARQAGVQVTLVVDFIHVLEYLWKAAWCFFDKGDRAAEDWVTERAGWILAGKSSDVAGGIRRAATRRNLEPNDRKGADSCADYLIAKRTMLRYHDYLAQGIPIATGVIEGACRHLIKDRMDITGARWGLDGAEAILRLRSLRSSGDPDDYWRFHLTQEHQRNHVAHYAGAA